MPLGCHIYPYFIPHTCIFYRGYSDKRSPCSRMDKYPPVESPLSPPYIYIYLLCSLQFLRNILGCQKLLHHNFHRVNNAWQNETFSEHGWWCCVIFVQPVPLLPSVGASLYFHNNLVIFLSLRKLDTPSSSLVAYKFYCKAYLVRQLRGWEIVAIIFTLQLRLFFQRFKWPAWWCIEPGWFHLWWYWLVE